MIFHENYLYHIYNQGNNRQPIFQDNQDYERFLTKTRILVVPNCDVLAYCLMPNHFHFLIKADISSVTPVKLGYLTSNKLSNAFRLLLSEYAQEYNSKYNKTGSLFRQKTKSKCLNDSESNYAIACFHYIHLNPLMANLVSDPARWNFSSLKGYLDPAKKGICQTEIAFREIGITENDLRMEINLPFDDVTIRNLYYTK